jgi:hypothetical protein
MKETAGMSCDDLKGAVWMVLCGRMVVLAAVIGNWAVVAV